MIATLLIATAASAPLESSPGLGLAEGRCRPGSPEIIVDVVGLKDRKGRLRLELYPANDRDFLADDNKLIAAGKAFARVDVPVPQAGPVRLCIRAPAPGAYTMSLLHDRDSNHKFGLSSDGIGFPGNPRLGWSKPSAAQATIHVGPGRTETPIVLNYRHTLFSFRPIEEKDRP